MKPRTLVAISLFVLVLLFAAINFETFTRPTSLNLLFATVDAPLGVVMLGVVAMFMLLYLFIGARAEIQGLFAERSYRKNLDAAHKVANSQEDSRLADLTALVQREFADLRKLAEESAEAARQASRDARADVTKGSTKT